MISVVWTISTLMISVVWTLSDDLRRLEPLDGHQSDDDRTSPVAVDTGRRSVDETTRQQSRLSVASSPDKAALLTCEQPDALAEPRRSMVVDEQERSKRKLARARERRATLILGIVMASFIGCWLPFFSIYPLSLLFDLDVPDSLFAVIFWLGYCNSALNPVIYTIFNREFRAAFVGILCRRRRPTGKRGGPGKHGGTAGNRERSRV